MNSPIDISFDVFSDTPVGRDPDAHSPTLKRYHKLLWSKSLPNGGYFGLSDATKGVYLHHQSDIGEYHFSSDAISSTFVNYKKMAPIISQVSRDEVNNFYSLSSTIGAYIIFPSKKINRKMTINGARGTSGKIKDRFDLSLECIRLHYAAEESPLGETLKRYSAFFNLFENFSGYVDFFLLQDLVSEDYTSVNFYLPFDGFIRSPFPQNIDEYRLYKKKGDGFHQGSQSADIN
jgi:hypothetical protein